MPYGQGGISVSPCLKLATVSRVLLIVRALSCEDVPVTHPLYVTRGLEK